ncbi:MAG: hypothetical protein FWF08_06065, partial [Oscillospiraceae bacterium]|nr:hypothetical protein [Oscillospiraceae bacterium]
TPAPNAEPVFKTREEGVLYPAGIYADPDDNAHLSASAEPEAAVSADIADCYRIQRPADYFGYEN